MQVSARGLASVKLALKDREVHAVVYMAGGAREETPQPWTPNLEPWTLDLGPQTPNP